MGHPAQPAPDHDVTCSADAGSRIHITVDEQIPIALEMVAGSQRALMEQQIRDP